MRKYLLSFFVFSVLLYADFTTKQLILPKNTWEVGLGHIDSEDHDTRGTYIPLRYALTDRLELIPFGIKYLIRDTKEEQLSLLTFMDVSYGTLAGWSLGSHLGFIWRNLDFDKLRITTMPLYTNKHSDIVDEHIMHLAVSSVYPLSPTFEAGLFFDPYYDKRSVDYSTISSTDYEKKSYYKWVTTIGAFIYYYFTENFNLKTGVYETTETGISYEGSYTYRSVLYRLEWRF